MTHSHRTYSTQFGLSLVGIVVAIGILMIIFAGIVGLMQLSLITLFQNKANVNAQALAIEQIEHIRSMPYQEVGTVGGIPDGSLQQIEKIHQENATFTRRTFIKYVDDDADGTGSSDANGITSDYKSVKVEVTWAHADRDGSFSAVTNVAPPGIETTSGGGTLTVNVFDANAQPVQGADVSIFNTAPDPDVAVTTYTDSEGKVTFPGTPADSGYRVSVSKLNHSSAQTYSVTSENVNPSPGHLTVVEGNTTGASFAIDELSDLTINTLQQYTDLTFTDVFTDTSKLHGLSNVDVSGGTVELAESSPGFYYASGTLTATATDPIYLEEWSQLQFSASTSPYTSVVVQMMYKKQDGSYAVIPDSDLSGNATGFSNSPIDLTSVPVDTYGAIAPRATLETSVSTTTPTLSEWTLAYRGGPTPLPDAGFELILDKTIGEDSSGNPLYKFTAASSTDSSGTRVLAEREWGSYLFSVGASNTYDIAAVCPGVPIVLPADSDYSTDIVYTSNGLHTLRVITQTSDGVRVNGADVTLTRGAYEESHESVLCGQSFFVAPSEGTVGDGDPYTVTVAHPDYATTTQSDVDVSGDSTVEVILNP